jgi:hypothetical protein
VSVLQFKWSPEPDKITADTFYEENNININWVIFTNLWQTSHYYLATNIRRNDCGGEREVLSYVGVASPAMKTSFVQNWPIGYRNRKYYQKASRR